MRTFIILLLGFSLFQPAMAATPPAASVNYTLTSTETVGAPFIKIKKATKNTWLQKQKQKILNKMIAKGYLLQGEPTERQKRQARWALILGLGSIVFVFLPYVALLSIPAAVAGLVLGIKSVEGNSNTQGIIGIIASGLTLLMLLLAVALAALVLTSWN